MKIFDVLPDNVTAANLDEEYVDNGNWIVAVNGRVLPGITAVVDAPVDAGMTYIRTDSRRAPAATLRHYNTEQYLLTLTCTSLQPSVLDEVLGMGAERLTQHDWNPNQATIGNLAAPTGPDDALFGIFLVTGAAPNHEVQILPRVLPHANYDPGSLHIRSYQHTLHGWVNRGPDFAWIDSYNGSGEITGATFPAAELITNYDPSADGIITFVSGEMCSVDFADPDLDPGDTAVILSFSYRANILDSSQDYGYTQPLERPERAIIDLYRSLSDDPEGRVWENLTFFDARQRRIPAASTSGEDEAANRRDYVFEVHQNACRLGGSKYFDRRFLLEAKSAS